MIGMTVAASSKMKEMLAAGVPATAGMRIDVQGDPCRPSFGFALVDSPVEGDYLIEDEGIRIFFAPGNARSLFNVEIDHDGSPDERGFSVRQTAACG